MLVCKIKDMDEKVLVLIEGKFIPQLGINELTLVQKLDGTKVAIEGDKLETIGEIKDE